MPNKTSKVNTLCPFYVSDSQKIITCEGLVRGTRIVMRFKSDPVKRRYQEGFCSRYEAQYTCPLARALTESYKGVGK